MKEGDCLLGCGPKSVKKGDYNLPKKNIGHVHNLSMLLYQITNVT